MEKFGKSLGKSFKKLVIKRSESLLKDAKSCQPETSLRQNLGQNTIEEF